MPKSAIAGSCDHYLKKETTNLLSRVILRLYISISDVWVIHFFCILAAAAAKLLHSCPTLCDPIDSSPPGSPVPWILQARTLEWVAISFSNAWKWKVKGKSLSRVRLLATPWTTAYLAPPSMGFSRQEYWSGLPLPSLNYVLMRRNRRHKFILNPVPTSGVLLRSLICQITNSHRVH